MAQQGRSTEIRIPYMSYYFHNHICSLCPHVWSRPDCTILSLLLPPLEIRWNYVVGLFRSLHSQHLSPPSMAICSRIPSVMVWFSAVHVKWDDQRYLLLTWNLAIRNTKTAELINWKSRPAVKVGMIDSYFSFIPHHSHVANVCADTVSKFMFGMSFKVLFRQPLQRYLHRLISI